MEKRKFELFERKLGKYDIAGAIYSWGDVIDFVDGERKGIIIADTCGHKKESGDRMKLFLRETIEAGWGTRYQAKHEVCDLVQKCIHAGGADPNKKWRSDPSYSFETWWDFVDYTYAQFGEKVSLSGLCFWLCNENGLERIHAVNNPYHGTIDTTIVEVSLTNNEALILSSDGLEGNIAHAWNLKDEEYSIKKVTDKLKKVIEYKKSAKDIRDKIVERFKHLFLPSEGQDQDLYDDITFAVVKRNYP